jgi:hypothetical protein
MHEPIDVVIPLGPRDRETVAVSLRSVCRFVRDVRTIYLVSRQGHRIENTKFIPESGFPFGLDTIATLLETRERAGWYLQQLIKLYFPSTHPACLDRVLAVDADTIFLRPCRFTENNRIVLNLGHEFHKPYFEHMARMHPALQNRTPIPALRIACCSIDAGWQASRARWRCTTEAVSGFAKIFLTAVDPDYRLLSGASEYETYFNYCLLRHLDEVILKQFCWDNAATIGELRPDLYDYVALHWHIRAEPIDAHMLDNKLSKLFSMPMP